MHPVYLHKISTATNTTLISIIYRYMIVIIKHFSCLSTNVYILVYHFSSFLNQNYGFNLTKYKVNFHLKICFCVQFFQSKILLYISFDILVKKKKKLRLAEKTHTKNKANENITR